MESDGTAKLSDPEGKLKELERELEAVGRGGETDAVTAQAGWTPSNGEAPPAPAAAPPAPPPPGATPLTTPFTASWHGTQQQGAAPPPPPPPPAFQGAPPPVPV